MSKSTQAADQLISTSSIYSLLPRSLTFFVWKSSRINEADNDITVEQAVDYFADVFMPIVRAVFKKKKKKCETSLLGDQCTARLDPVGSFVEKNRFRPPAILYGRRTSLFSFLHISLIFVSSLSPFLLPFFLCMFILIYNIYINTTAALTEDNDTEEIFFLIRLVLIADKVFCSRPSFLRL